MLNFCIRRFFYSLLVICGVMMLTFVLFNLAAGDPAAAALGKNAKPEEIENFRRELGADLPLFYGHERRTEAFQLEDGVYRRKFAADDVRVRIISADGSSHEKALDAAVIRLRLPKGSRAEFFRRQENPFNSQFFRAFGEILHFKGEFPYVEFFDFGRTISTREPIRELLWNGVWASLALMIPVFFGEMFFGMVLALIATAFRDRWPDRLLVVLSVCFMSVSYLVLIIGSQWLFGYRLGWFPLWGFAGPRYLILPVLTGILFGVGGNIRFFRTVFIDELGREYLRTAVAKGEAPWRVYGVHLLRNASLQIITKAGAGLPFLFTGSLLLESFFGIPGLGFVGVDALYNSDIQLLKAVVVLSSILFVVINFLTDLAYAWADPRVRVTG
jgi:peptide/nickel transport system permease protein